MNVRFVCLFVFVLHFCVLDWGCIVFVFAFGRMIILTILILPILYCYLVAILLSDEVKLLYAVSIKCDLHKWYVTVNCSC